MGSRQAIETTEDIHHVVNHHLGTRSVTGPRCWQVGDHTGSVRIRVVALDVQGLRSICLPSTEGAQQSSVPLFTRLTV